MIEYLTDVEIEAVEAFNKNEVMKEAVKKVLLQHIYTQGVITKGKKHDPLKNRALVIVSGDYDDEQLGGRLRSLWEGVNALETGFTDLEKIKSKKGEPVETTYNEAE